MERKPRNQYWKEGALALILPRAELSLICQ